MARNEWFTAVEQTLPEYVPLPMDRLFQAGQLLQNRYDSNMKALDDIGVGLSSIEAASNKSFNPFSKVVSLT